MKFEKSVDGVIVNPFVLVFTHIMLPALVVLYFREALTVALDTCQGDSPVYPVYVPDWFYEYLKDSHMQLSYFLDGMRLLFHYTMASPYTKDSHVQMSYFLDGLRQLYYYSLAFPVAGLVVLVLRRTRLWLRRSLMVFMSFIGAAFVLMILHYLYDMHLWIYPGAWHLMKWQNFIVLAGYTPMIYSGLTSLAVMFPMENKVYNYICLGGFMFFPFAMMFFCVLDFYVTNSSVVDAKIYAMPGRSPMANLFLIGLGHLGTIRTYLVFIHWLAKKACGKVSSWHVRFMLLFFAVPMAIMFWLNHTEWVPYDMQCREMYIFAALATLAAIPWGRGRTGEGFAPFARFCLQMFALPFMIIVFLSLIPYLPRCLMKPALVTAMCGVLPAWLSAVYVGEICATARGLRSRHSRLSVFTAGAMAFAIAPAWFLVDVELERVRVNELVEWHENEDYDSPRKAMPMTESQAKATMGKVNDDIYGTFLPIVSDWREQRVYGGMFIPDILRNELNSIVMGGPVDPILKRSVPPSRRYEVIMREHFHLSPRYVYDAPICNRNNWFGLYAVPFWHNDDDRSCRADFSALVVPRALKLSDDGYYMVLIKTVDQKSEEGDCTDLDFRLAAGAMIVGAKTLKIDGTWGDCPIYESKSSQWIYGYKTEKMPYNQDFPKRFSFVLTLDSHSTGRLRSIKEDYDPKNKERANRLLLLVRVPEAGSVKELMAFSYHNRPEGQLRVLMPDYEEGRAHDMMVASDAPLTVIPDSWVESHMDCVFTPQAGQRREFDMSSPLVWSDLRRAARAAKRKLDETGVLDSLVPAGYDSFGFPGSPIGRERLAALRRELPGMAEFGDRPVDGWISLEVEGGGRIAVPWRKGEGALAFARIKGAKPASAAWSRCAKAMALENESFMKPFLDRRREVVATSRDIGVLTPETAFVNFDSLQFSWELWLLEKDSLNSFRLYRHTTVDFANMVD